MRETIIKQKKDSISIEIKSFETVGVDGFEPPTLCL